MINLKWLKSRIIAKYPGELITEVLKSEPDEVSEEELIAKIATWQSIMDAEHGQGDRSLKSPSRRLRE